jgi:hypothetical protein
VSGIIYGKHQIKNTTQNLVNDGIDNVTKRVVIFILIIQAGGFLLEDLWAIDTNVQICTSV